MLGKKQGALEEDDKQVFTEICEATLRPSRLDKERLQQLVKLTVESADTELMAGVCLDLIRYSDIWDANIPGHRQHRWDGGCSVACHAAGCLAIKARGIRKKLVST